MTADARRHCGDRESDCRRPKTTSTTRTTATCTAVVVIAAVVAAVAVTATRATTFEGGETATVPPDDTVYMTEEVAAWNATAAANGDYVYDDYDSSTADALQMPPGNHHYSPKPVKPVTPVDASTAVPAATITVQIHSAAVTEVPVTNVSSSAAVTEFLVTNTTAAVDSTTTTATTESGVLMQIASPPGYEATTAIVAATAPTPTTPNSSAPLLHCRRWTAILLLSLALIATVAP